MASTEQQVHDITKIFIPPDRQRTKVSEGKISSLAVSIQTKGLLNPIVVAPLDRVRFPDAAKHLDVQLVAGYRRYLSFALLKKLQIPVNFRDDITDRVLLEEIELDENLEREELSWQDEIRAKARLVELRKENYGEGIREVAEKIGESRGELWEDANLAKAMTVLPELGEAKNKSAAKSKLRLLNQRATLMVKAQEYQVGTRTINPDISKYIFLGDCLETIRSWESASIDCVVTDPPYGINLDVGQTKRDSHHPVIYSDNTYDIMDLTTLVIKEAYRLLKDNTHAYFFFDIKAYPKIIRMLTDAGFTVEPMPLIWTKPGPGQTNHPESRWGSGYETCFFCRKGTRPLLKQGQSNVLPHDPVPAAQKIHPVEKPVSLIRQLIESSTAPGEVVVDFFGGSGSTAEAALQLNRNFRICEKDPAFHAGIVERLQKFSNKDSNIEPGRQDSNGHSINLKETIKSKFDPLAGEEED